MDVARFGDWATMAYTNAKVRENYSRRFRIRFPNEELPAARPLRMTPVYDRLKAKGAVFGAAFGLEHALWFAPPGTEAREDVTYRRSNAHAPVGEECRAVRNAVGLLETSSFAKYEVTGAGAGAWLEQLLANKLPREGRLTLSPMLNEDGKLIGDFTVANAGRGRYLRVRFRRCRAISPALVRSASAAVRACALRALRTELLGLGIAGPRSRELLSQLTAEDVSNAALPFLSFRAMDVAMLPAHVGRISFTGELGYEIWVPADCQLALVRGDRRGRCGSRIAALRRARAPFAAARKELRQLGTRISSDLHAGRGRPRPVRRCREGGLHRPRGGAPRRGARSRAPPRHVRRRRERRRRDRRRAGVARRRGRRLDHVRRLRPLRRQVDRAWLHSGGAFDRDVGIRDRNPRRSAVGNNDAPGRFTTRRASACGVHDDALAGVGNARRARGCHARAVRAGARNRLPRRRLRTRGRVRQLRGRMGNGEVRRADIRFRRRAAEQSVPPADDGDLRAERDVWRRSIRLASRERFAAGGQRRARVAARVAGAGRRHGKDARGRADGRMAVRVVCVRGGTRGVDRGAIRRPGAAMAAGGGVRVHAQRKLA